MSYNNCCPQQLSCPQQQCCAPKPCCRTITYRCTKPPPPQPPAPPPTTTTPTDPTGGGGTGNNTGNNNNNNNRPPRNTNNRPPRNNNNRPPGGGGGGGPQFGAELPPVVDDIGQAEFTIPLDSTGSGRPRDHTSAGGGRPTGGGIILPPNQKCEDDDPELPIDYRSWPTDPYGSTGGGRPKRKWPILPWSGPLPKQKWDDPWRGHCECDDDDNGGTTRTPPVPPPVPGCMDPAATNYNPSATVDDNSCTYTPPPPVPGCTDPLALNYNPLATVDDNSCLYSPPPPVAGCTDPAATNYNSLATVDDNSCVYPPPPLPGACNDLGQLTPNYRRGNEGGAADINLATQVSQAVASVVSQDPDGILWLSSAQWAAAEWDGIPFDTSGWPISPTTAQLHAYLFPNANTMRGLRQHFYTINPFADNTAPTVAEIDQWNVEVVRCLRKVLGITTPVGGSKCLFLRCQWSLERKWSTVWDPEYPSGVCYPIPPAPTGQPHCGDSFVPTPAEQVPYWDGATPTVCVQNAGSVGLSSVNTDIPWSVKLSRVIGGYVASEGMTGHPGPFFTRECCGFSFMIFDGPLGGGGTSEYRGKWSN